MTSVIGLDIGQYHSKIGCARNRGIDILVNEVSNRATPSLVAFGPKSRIIGEPAKTQETSNFKNTIGSLKRLIGRSFDDPDVELERKFINAELVPTDDNKVAVKVTYLGEPAVFTVTQLYAMFLGRLKETAHGETKAPVNDIVIAVPVWYTEAQRRAVLEAADIAGLNALRLINDTTAVALQYGITKTDLPEQGEKPKNVAFIDIGHSDFSVSLVSFNKGSLVVKSTAYDRHFGGRDLDYALVEHFIEEFKGKYKIDVSTNKKAYFRLSAAVEKLKKILSANPAAPLNVESIMNDLDVSSQITRDEFEALIAPLLERTVAPLERALAEAGLAKEDIDTVELVGGSTRVPSLKTRVEEYFGRPLSFTCNQDEAVARGATLACAMLSPVFKVRDFSITDTVLFPVKLVWPAADAAADEGTELVAFDKGNNVPSTKLLSFYRSGPFEVAAEYVDASSLPGKFSPVIGSFTVNGVKGPEPQHVKVRARVNLSGIFTFEGASLYEEVEEEVTEKEGEETVKSMKKVTRKTPLKAAASTPLATAANAIDSFKEKEGQMAATDKLVRETEDRKNALEEYVYDVRDKMDTVWSKFITAEEKEQISKLALDAEDWLYSEEGEDASKSAYVSRLDALRALGDPVQFRYREVEERPRAAAQLREVIQTFGDKANAAANGDAAFAHLAEKDVQSVIEATANAESWLSNKLASQAEKPLTAKPVITSSDMKKRAEELFNLCSPIMNRPAPRKTVVPETKDETKEETKEEAKAETEEAEAEEPKAEAEEMDVD